MTMSRAEKATAVLTIRLDTGLSRSLEREARRRRKTKSEVAREILAAGLGSEEQNPIAEEARRQSLLVSRRRSEKEALEFMEHTADIRGWK
jgi:predicted transcriptional regulator